MVATLKRKVGKKKGEKGGERKRGVVCRNLCQCGELPADRGTAVRQRESRVFTWMT